MSFWKAVITTVPATPARTPRPMWAARPAQLVDGMDLSFEVRMVGRLREAQRRMGS
jgi:hypothetical protein